MHPIEPYALWLGHAGEYQDPTKLFDLGIQAVVALAREELPAVLPRELLSFRIPLVDGSGNEPLHLKLAVELVSSLIAARVPTLVYCGAGMSRSPGIVACALARLQQREPSACLELLHHQVKTDVSTSFWRDLVAANA